MTATTIPRQTTAAAPPEASERSAAENRLGQKLVAPALIMIGFWFLLQLISGAGSIVDVPNSGGGGGVAYWAHIGGFVAGLVLVWIFRRRATGAPLLRY